MYRIGDEEVEALRRVIESRRLFRAGDSPGEVDRFEEEWAAKIGSRYALCLSGGGTAALVAALASLEIGPGDEVIVPAYTWLATASAVLAVGAVPVLADIDATLSLDPEDTERKISAHTKAIIPVHMMGRAADLESLLAIAKRHNLKLIEDACQMDGGSYRGRRVGSWGDVGAFSFNFFKIISAGEGGALVTDDRRLYERALIFSDSGANFRSYKAGLAEPIFIGQQFRATELMGAVLRVQLGRLDGILADLRRVRQAFEEELAGVLTVAPNNDTEGDCGVVAAFQFENEMQARAFAGANGVEGRVQIDSDKHVYTNWTPIWQKRIGHCADMNPFNHPKNQGLGRPYDPGMCRRTLDYLRRTVFINMNPDWDDTQVRARIDACCQAAKAVGVASRRRS